MFNKVTLQKLAELKTKKKALDAELKEVKEEINDAECAVLEMFGEEGLDQVKAGGYTFSVNRKLNGSVSGGVEGVQALIDAGMIECTTVGWQRTAAVIREFTKAELEDDPLLSMEQIKAKFEDENPKLKGLVRIYEDYGVSMRKAT